MTRTTTRRARPWRLVQTWEPDGRRVWACFETRERALAAKNRETRLAFWISVKWRLERWNGYAWVPAEGGVQA